jgi:hypothetical protein
LEGKLDLLIRSSWGSREDNKARGFVFDEGTVQGSGNEAFTAALLKHVRFNAPILSVPFMNPRIEVSQLATACGQFVEEDGWVKLVVSTEFAANPAASRAILCHELCHYILSANGIRMTDRDDNERLTDVAMFAFGMGAVFLKGYRAKFTASDGHRHRMDYLTDYEYQFLSTEAIRLRLTGERQDHKRHELQGKLLNRLNGDRSMLERYMAHSRQRFPTKSESERIQALLDDFSRGR